MNRRNYFLSSMLLSAVLLMAQKPGKYVSTPVPVSDAKNLSGYESANGDPLNARIYTLKNGLKVYLSVYKNAPRIQTYIAVRAGSKNDPPEATGLAHYLEHMVFKGSDVFGTKDFKKESVEIKKIEDLYEQYRGTRDENKRRAIYRQIDSISGVAAKYAIANEYDKMLAAIGADGTNAFTSFDQTVYTNDIPANQVSNWLKIEAERFRKPVLRLFHTELEAVYEEKNRGLDSDNEKVWEALFAGLFTKHTYGTQTTIGTIEHLKNPSMVEINKFYNTYYVPNNMAIVMSGDFDPDKVIVEIEKNFGSFQPKPVLAYTFQPEPELTQKVVKEVVGPNPATMVMSWRLAGEGSRDADMCAMLSGMLYNGTAGLVDINLNQSQKVLSCGTFYYPLRDYSIFGFSADPKEGQTLEEAEKLALGQLDLIRKGEFPEWLMQAVITDLKLKKTKELESNQSRAEAMMSSFTNGMKWQHTVSTIERLEKITRQDIIDFVKNKLTDNNYVVVYKRTGEDKSVQKVEKPPITPVEVDRDNASDFVKAIEKSTPKAIEPTYLDYDKDIKKASLKSGMEVLYNRNTENKLFELYYKFNMGSNNGKLFPVAIKYIPYLATEDMSAAAIKEELYKYGCSFNVFCDYENIWVSLTGLSTNFDKALALFEKVLAKPVVEETVLKNLVNDILKERQDNKLQKSLILNRGMVNYALFGAVNPYSNVLSNAELEKVTTAEIRQTIAGLLSYEHRVLYYGPSEMNSVLQSIANFHKTPEKLLPPPAASKYDEKTLSNSVYVVDYDMKQVEIIMLSNGNAYNPAAVPIIELYNNYFGGGMSSVMFQDLRESKALAYATYSRYNRATKPTRRYYNVSYIGSQSDKLQEALKGMSDLLNTLPKSEGSFNAAKESLIQEMRTQRITRSQIIFNYLQAQEFGHKTDIRRDIFAKAQTYTFADVKKFHEQNIRNKPTTVLVLGKKELLDMKTLEKYGTVKTLTLEEVFGY